MANPSLTAQPRSYVAGALFVSFLAMVVYGILTRVTIGPIVYLTGIASLVSGMMAKEDIVSVGSVMLLALLVILDVLLGVGILVHH